MSGIGSLASRLVVVALVAVGLVGMHHLVVAACHHGASHGDHAAVLSMDSVVDHGSHGPAGPAPVPAEAPSDGSDGAPGGLVGVAATCLAILLMVIGLVLPHVLARVRRSQAMRLFVAAPPMADRTPKPPDLTLLSVSRT